MESVRLWIRAASANYSVHPQLIANFDQVCTCHFKHTSHTLFKPKKDRGDIPKPMQKPSIEKLLESIKVGLGLATPSNEQSVVEYTVRNPVLNAEGSLNPVDYARVARTTTTLTWCDGTMGVAYVTAPNSTMPRKVVEAMNEELKGVAQLSFRLEDCFCLDFYYDSMVFDADRIFCQ